MIYGYVLISTGAQYLDNPLVWLKAARYSTVYRKQEVRQRIEAGETQRNVAQSYCVVQAMISTL